MRLPTPLITNLTIIKTAPLSSCSCLGFELCCCVLSCFNSIICKVSTKPLRTLARSFWHNCALQSGRCFFFGGGGSYDYRLLD